MVRNEERWSSASMPPRRQLAGFQEVLDRTHFHWGLTRGDSGAYHAKVQRRIYDRFVFTHIVADPVAGFRTSDDVKRGIEDYFCLLYFEEGNCLLRQGRNESHIRRNSIALWDSSRPAMFDCDAQLRQLSILIPRETGKMMVPGIEDMCGLSVDGERGLGAILLSHLRQVHQMIDTIAASDRPAVLRASIELIAAAFRPDDQHQGATSFRRSLLGRVQDHIVANLGDPALSPASIAATFRFSARYLHRLFEDSELTVGGWIRKRRLMAAKADLSNPHRASLSVTEIAMRHGFADASHFSHAFREEYGIAPRDFRRNVQDDPTH